MSLPPWKVAVTEWDRLVLGDFTMPGLWTIKVAPSRKIQVDVSKDTNGATLTDNGYQGAKVTGSGRLWTDEQVAEFSAILPFFNPRTIEAGTSPTLITHPLTTLYGIRAIFISSWDVGTPGPSELTVKFSAVEWFPGPKPNPTSPSPRPGGGGRPSPAPDPGLTNDDFNVPPPDPNFKGGKFA